MKCPFCKTLREYKNCYIQNKLHYEFYVSCRNCYKRYYAVSFLRKFEMNHYQKLEFLRKRFLSMRDKMLKKEL